MNLINCNKKCIHQKDGYCKLDHVSVVTNLTSSGCCHFIPEKDILDSNVSLKKYKKINFK